MIGLLIQDNQYEQDTRESLMSLYPGEAYIHKVKDGANFYVETQLGDGAVSIYIWENAVTTEDYGGDKTRPEGCGRGAAGSELGKEQVLSCPEGLKDWMLGDSCTRLPDLSDHSVTKNVIKKMFYLMLVARTGKEMPQGSLTDIRPTKIALTRLEEGWKEGDIRSLTKEIYLVNDEKIDLSIEIMAREKKLLEPLDYERGYSLYVGIPFCPTTCLYCSSTPYPIGKWKGRTGLHLEALFKGLEYTARKMEGRPLDTVRFGGGVPTSLSAEDLEALLNRLEQLFNLSRVLELTVEAGRPNSIMMDKLKVLRDHGTTRISINPQTMNQETLDLIDRHHTVDTVKDRFYMARELGLDNINMDLIMGLPEENTDGVRRTLEEVKALAPDFLTVHSLAIKRATRLNMSREGYGGLKIQNTSEMTELSVARARQTGMEPYYSYRQRDMASNFENVEYSLSGKAYIYNILIMEEMQTIAACGTGTITKVVLPSENRKERCENVKEVEQYISRINEMIQRKERIL